MKSEFSSFNRHHQVEKLKSTVFDLVIIGGGINGAGVARDAASRGLKVALVEKSDFASGTSSRSSKLVHGGIRYLENMEFHLVFEALSERSKLFSMAPNLVHPLRFLLPVYKNSRVGMFIMGLGMWLYDALALFDTPEMHQRLDPGETGERIPQLNSTDLVGSFVYSDAYMDDDRLVHATLRSAVNQGAICLNYVEAGTAKFKEEKMCAVNVTDIVAQQNFSIRGRHFISTVGPWTDQVASEWLAGWRPILRPTKGIHLTLPRERFPIKEAVVMAVDSEKRIVFAIPRHEMVIVGTTDTDFQGNPAAVKIEQQDLDYLMKVTNSYFPGLNLTREDLIAGYAGVRPLVNDGSEEEGKTSREHTILSDPRNITFVGGGKYTTYRLMSEQIVDRALESFDRSYQIQFGRSNTNCPLSEYTSVENFKRAQLYVNEWAQEFHRDVSDVELLVERHGMEAGEILSASVELKNIWQIEALFAIHNTMCMDLIDFYTRRVPLFLAHKNQGLEYLDSIAEVFAAELKWDEQQLENQKSLLKSHIKLELDWL